MAEKVTKAETRHARQLFLYGNGDGRRITAAVALAEAAGLHVETVRRHLTAWEAEYEQILAGTSTGGLGLSLSKKQVEQHTKDMAFLRDQIAQVTWECDNLDSLVANLEGLVEKFAGTDESDKAVVLLDRYLRSSLNKQNLRGQFLQLQRQWTKLSGVESLMDISLTREKTLATGKAKMDLKAGEGKDPRDVTPSRTGIFALEVPAIQD